MYYECKDYFTLHNQDWNSDLVINFGITCGICSMELSPDIVVKIRIFKVSNMNF